MPTPSDRPAFLAAAAAAGADPGDAHLFADLALVRQHDSYAQLVVVLGDTGHRVNTWAYWHAHPRSLAGGVGGPSGLRVLRGTDLLGLPRPTQPGPDLRTTPRRLTVVPCSGAKLDRPAPAAALYTGSWHRLAASAARALGGPWAILSAEHGLLDPDAVVAPYDRRMGAPGAVTAERLADQLLAWDAHQLVALTPGDYTRALVAGAEQASALASLTVQVVTPLAGAGGVGVQRGRLAALRDGRATLAAAA